MAFLLSLNCTLQSYSENRNISCKSSSTSHNGLSKGAKLGLGLGLGIGVPLLVALIVAVYFYWRKRKRETANEDISETQQLDSRPRFEAPSQFTGYEADSPASHSPVELDGEYEPVSDLCERGRGILRNAVPDSADAGAGPSSPGQNC